MLSRRSILVYNFKTLTKNPVAYAGQYDRLLIRGILLSRKMWMDPG